MTDLPRPATHQLLQLAAACRPDWSIDQLREAVAQVRCHDDMSFGRLLVAVAQLIADPVAEPPDLLAAPPELWRRRRRPPGPEIAQRGAAAARAALHRPDTTDCTEGT
ncbi:hypothetical protein LXH13_06430 [Streptomyces spinosirectus]|jgi:hypothetical protein|uniref:hypothetical protein n=1 Tax=Streptomyces TaxID=1883 RepID=UPI0013E8B918|nr:MULTISPECIES: hypothetical protein [Streptomyces]MBY8341958.1 hypothetical protein [Streptomyces plumbidurans]UIR16693.1 hypothetical protein LXH13_06430 [Streptomyces spinosirectus]